MISVAMAALLAILPNIPPFKQHILSFSERKASSLLLCKVTIGEITLDIRKGFVANTIVLSNSHSGTTPLRAKQVAARINLSALVKGRFAVGSIKIKGLRGELVRTHQGLFAGPIDIGRIGERNHKEPNQAAGKSKPLVRIVVAESCTISYVDSVAKIKASEIVHRIRLEFIRGDSLSFVMEAGAGHFSSPVWRGGVNSAGFQGAVGPSSLLFTKTAVQGDSVLLVLSGTIPFAAGKAVNLTANAEAFVGGFLGANGKEGSPKNAGKLKANGVMTGTFGHPIVSLNIKGYGLQAGSVAADSLHLQAHYSQSRLRGKAQAWSRLWNAGSGFYVVGSGRQRLFDTLDANIRMMTVPSAKNPVVVVMHLIGNRWALSGVMKPNFKMEGKGRYTDGGTVDGSIHIRADETERIAALFLRDGIHGSLVADANMRGTFARPEISATVQLGQCSYDRYHADTVSAQLRYSDHSMRWKSLTVKRGKSVLQSNGAIIWINGAQLVDAGCEFTYDDHEAGTFSTKARFENDSLDAFVALEDLNPVVVSPWFPRAYRLQGSLGVHGTVAGTVKNPAIRLKSSFDHEVSGGRVSTTTGDLALANRIATATMKVVPTGSGAPLTIATHVPVAFHNLSKGVAAIGEGAVIALSGDSVSYGGLVSAFVPSIQSKGIISIHGKLLKTNGEWGLLCSTHIAVDGLTEKMQQIKAGRMVFDLHATGPVVRPEVRFALNGNSIEYRGNLVTAYWGSGSIKDNVLKLDTLHLAGKGGGAGLRAVVPVSLRNGFSFKKNSHISATFAAMPIGIMQPFMPDPVEINRGEMSGRVSIEGTAKGVLQTSGTLLLQNGEFYLYECDKPLGPLSADIEFKNNLITLRRLEGDWGDGRVLGSGWAVLEAEGVSSAYGVLNVSNAHLDGCYENLDLGIETADINLTKDSLVTIQVKAVLADTRFTRDISLIDIGERMKRKSPQTLRPPNPLFNKIVMRIAVNCNSNLTFDSNLGKVLVDGSMTVTGRPNRPKIVGQLQILNGFVYYLDRKFTVTQGTVRQYDPQSVNPSFDVTATSAVSWYPPQGERENYDIALLIRGDLSNPLITLSAVPALSQPQIISLLTLGTIQTGAGADLGSRTGSLVSLQLAGFGTRKLARFLNVESVDIYGNVFGPSSLGPQLSVTKQVSSRVAVTYKAGLSKFGRQMVLVSYRVLSFLYLEAESDQQTQGGVDLKFRYSR